MAPRRTKADAMATRNALLDAAERLFEEKGVSRTSLQDIAGAAGATRGAIYWHFKDKADLFNAMMERATAPLDQLLLDPRPGAPAPDMDRVFEAMLEALHRIATDASLRRVMQIAIHRVEYVQELDAVQARHLTMHRQWLAHNRSALERAFAGRSCPATVPPDMAALGLQVLVEGLLQGWLLDTEAFDLVQAGRSTIATYLRGLGLEVKTPAP
ncbi:TetR family transcriptional regulator [Simplicispira lacusdiani]|uniref:TetR family transcriptional regulator n=1 Tax=Simplicispira lacusdiani TaxID=2213010 RepID=UPI000E738B76|nr:TetR family transcriptional regulator [Simplicispira lacusdiani]